MYPDYGKDGKLLTLKVSKERCAGKFVVMGPRGDETPFLRKKEQWTHSYKNRHETSRSWESQELIVQMENEIEAIPKTIQEDEIIADDEYEDQ